MKRVFNAEFLCSWDTIHRNIVHYLTLYSVILNQYNTCVLQIVLEFSPFSLTLVCDREIGCHVWIQQC